MMVYLSERFNLLEKNLSDKHAFKSKEVSNSFYVLSNSLYIQNLAISTKIGPSDGRI